MTHAEDAAPAGEVEGVEERTQPTQAAPQEGPRARTLRNRDVYRWSACECGCGGYELGRDDWYFWASREPGSEGSMLSPIHNKLPEALGPFREWDMLELKVVSLLEDKIAPVKRAIETVTGIFDERRRRDETPTVKLRKVGTGIV